MSSSHEIYDFFFFSSRRRHTRYWRDWSSDVCSSDLSAGEVGDHRPPGLDQRLDLGGLDAGHDQRVGAAVGADQLAHARVGEVAPTHTMASTTIATTSRARYEIETWNSCMGLVSPPRLIRLSSRCDSRTNQAPSSAAGTV